MLRWGLLGAASITASALAPAMRAAGHDLAVVGARDRGRAQAFAARQGVRRARGSYAEVVEADDVDAVYVALPNDLHEQWSVAALQAGKHVLCEKPLTVGAASAGRMAAASGTAGRLLMEAIMTRFHPRTDALLELVHGGEIGEVRHVTASFGFTMRKPGDYRAEVEHGGGALLDLGLYTVAVTRWLMGAEPAVAGAVQRRWPSAVDATTAALLRFPGGATAAVTASFESAPHQFVEVVGSDATVRVPHAFGAGASDDAVLLVDGRPVGSWRANPYQRMVEAFAAAVAAGGPAPLPIDDAVATAAALEGIAATVQ